MKLRKPIALEKALRHSQTEAETRVWTYLKAKRLEGIKFRRQQSLGAYIVDFVSFEVKLIIEIDGGQHNEASQQAKDDIRTRYLESQGFRVLRFWNSEVTDNLDGVFLTIKEAVQTRIQPGG